MYVGNLFLFPFAVWICDLLFARYATDLHYIGKQVLSGKDC